MAFIAWQPEFNLGIDIIDQQHRMLVVMINELHDSFLSGKDRKNLANLINRLGVYAAMHFAREEHFFEISDYSGKEAHEKEHAAFDNKVSLFEHDFIAGRKELTIEILRFLSDWLIRHINASDRDYTPFLKAKGIL